MIDDEIEEVGFFGVIWRFLFGKPIPKCGVSYCCSETRPYCSSNSCVVHCSMFCKQPCKPLKSQD